MVDKVMASPRNLSPGDDFENMAGDYDRNNADVLNLDDDEYVENDSARWNDMENNMEDCEEMSDEEPEMSPDGILDEDTVEKGLSNLGRSADGTQQVFLHITVPGVNLIDISLLAEYVHLQKVEIPYNEISDLSPLSNMPFLLELDASHNQICTLLDFTPPRNLKVVDLSYNNIEYMSDLSDHHFLQKLSLDNNYIMEIKGLEGCQRLTHLSIAHNKISKIQGIEDLPLRSLNLSGNALTTIESIKSLCYLQCINLSCNKIRSLKGLEGHDFLENIDVEGNEIIDMSEIEYVKNLRLLRELNLLRNPIRELPDYRLSVLFHLQRITELDRRRVDVEEKVAATNMFNPPMEVIAARDHIMHVVYAFLQPQRVLDSTLPTVETPFPMLVLVGPQGAGKKDLALKLTEEFPDYFGYGISHTTRKPHPEETDGKDYHFINLEEFEEKVKQGKFVQTYSYHGNLYGLTIDAIEAVAREGLACVVHMELEGVLTMKNTYFEPRYVLIMPLNRDAHERRLRERGIYSENQIEWTLDRSEVYAEQNRQHPGFFDMMINSDDITDCYRRLRRLVMDYLGMAVPSPEQSEANDQSQTGSQLYLDREPTEMTAGSANMGARTWSKPSIPDSGSQAVAAGSLARPAVPLSPMPPSRGVVEEESLKRRQSAAKEAVAGHMPSLYEQLLGKTPKTVPQSVVAQQGLGDEEGLRSYSAPPNDNMDALPPSSPDSSEGQSSTGSSLSNISEAHGAATPEASPKGSRNERLPSGLDDLDMMSGAGSEGGGGETFSAPLAPRPGSRGSGFASPVIRPGSGFGSRPGSQLGSARSNRPGSEKHPILPPIGGSPKPALPAY